VTRQYIGLLDALAAAGLTGTAEVSIKLSALGQALRSGAVCKSLVMPSCSTWCPWTG
jgi:hypothetical protein